MSPGKIDESRRTFLRRSFGSAGLLVIGASLVRCDDEAAVNPTTASTATSGGSSATTTGGGQGGSGGSPLVSNIENLGPLGEPDENGVRLPAGFTSRIVARSGKPVGDTGHVWHGAPDGGAVFPVADGWIYVSNSEISGGSGGVGAIRFANDGAIVAAYSILTGTSRNCAGGPTPWGTWLSCEEVASGKVWECDPAGRATPTAWPALGIFNHEAVAVDPIAQVLYLTEDEPDGRLYRFTPDRYPDLSKGKVEVLRVLDGRAGATEWLPLPDPSAADQPTRIQVPTSTAFDGGEGIWFHQGVIYFTTKGDNRVWAYETATGHLTILYDDDTSPMPILKGVDNVTVTPSGDVLVAEDGGSRQIVAITPRGALVPLMALVGHDDSEITGPAFDPTHRRLYFSSQRGTTGNASDGITFEVAGPFVLPA